ncbi:LCP family protein [uncultured Streptomyces sp.]|uniref:LCP family protein n=1 Tax=uncultured Streptomyces sp. TaxID=174707 RepID=UPI0026046975|nr:LCP family protein [uncultured Streptomyces sp.]
MDADVTDSAGRPDGPHRPDDDEERDGPRSSSGAAGGSPAASGGADGPAPGAGAGAGTAAWADRPKDAFPRRERHWVRWTALAAAFVVLVAAGVGWWLYRRLDGNIRTDDDAAAELRAYEKERPTAIASGAQNILLIGSDSRAGDNAEYGRDDHGRQRSDTTILLHLPADRKSATAVSVPRDLMADVPACHTADGGTSREQFAQFNWAFQYGGAACTIRTLEKMTGIRVDHHMIVDFSGFKDMVDAVDGVDVCLREPIDDKAAHLRLPAGRHRLDGEQALGYVRARKSLGDGSDTDRMDRQQKFLGALVNKVQSNGVLLNPTKLYPVLDAATKSLTTDPGLDSLRDLYDLVRGMRNVPTDKVQFLTVPRKPYSLNANRDELVEPDATRLFAQLRQDVPVEVVPADGGDTATPTPAASPSTAASPSAASSASPAPTYSGTNAAEDLCKR